jgi:hypothetical protein
MPAILAQMRRYTLAPAFGDQQSCAQRVGMGTAAGVSQRRHMVDVDAQALMQNH